MDPSLGDVKHVRVAFRIAMMRLTEKFSSLFCMCRFVGFEYRTRKEEGQLSWDLSVTLRDLLDNSHPSDHLCWARNPRTVSAVASPCSSPKIICADSSVLDVIDDPTLSQGPGSDLRLAFVRNQLGKKNKNCRDPSRPPEIRGLRVRFHYPDKTIQTIKKSIRKYSVSKT